MLPRKALRGRRRSGRSQRKLESKRALRTADDDHRQEMHDSRSGAEGKRLKERHHANASTASPRSWLGKKTLPWRPGAGLASRIECFQRLGCRLTSPAARSARVGYGNLKPETCDHRRPRPSPDAPIERTEATSDRRQAARFAPMPRRPRTTPYPGQNSASAQRLARG
jgi:hypothetical protein